MTDDIKRRSLCDMFTRWAGSEPVSVLRLPLSGSNRQYFRLSSAEGSTAIGVVGENDKENNAFLSFSAALRKARVNVPEVYASDLALGTYLQQDLGSMSLFDFLKAEKAANGGQFTTKLKEAYRRVLASLAELQVRARGKVDYSQCYPRQAFDRQSMLWDMQYFKYYFLKLAHVDFDEQQLEADFDTFASYLLEANTRFFLYRDFQSRNIMLDAGLAPWFIDYQGGRQGARQYDVASLLYDAKADIPNAVRNELLAFYLTRLRPNEASAFTRHYYGYAVIRIMQAMGAYGYRGFFERKEHFLRSIPFALDNMADIIRNHRPEVDLPELWRVLNAVADSESLRALGDEPKPRLCVRVSSFSYKKGLPSDPSGNGGGYVFDCRALPNPGRYEEYKAFTGKDEQVRRFFSEHEPEMTPFLDAVKKLVAINVERYMSRGFTHLCVAFGCTGGQHRSVYSAEVIADWLRKTYDVDVVLQHREQEGRA